MNSTLAAAPAPDERTTLAFELGMQAGQRLAEQHARLTAVAASSTCPLPDCGADHAQDDGHRSAVVYVGPFGIGMEIDDDGSTYVTVASGDTERLDLDEARRLRDRLDANIARAAAFTANAGAK